MNSNNHRRFHVVRAHWNRLVAIEEANEPARNTGNSEPQSISRPGLGLRPFANQDAGTQSLSPSAITSIPTVDPASRPTISFPSTAAPLSTLIIAISMSTFTSTDTTIVAPQSSPPFVSSSQSVATGTSSAVPATTSVVVHPSSATNRVNLTPIVGGALAAFVPLFAISVYVYRKWSVRKRLRLRSWADRGGLGSVSPWVDYRERFKADEPAHNAVRRGNVRIELPPGVPTVEDVSFVPHIPRPPPAHGVSTSGGETRVLSPHAPEYGTVVSTFIPTLPDELSINAGDVLRILAEYDDGWALCLNSRGEKGMVPVECFNRQVSTEATSKQESRKSTASRLSSLAVNPYDGITH